MKTYYVYILSSPKNGTLYVGITNDIIRRVYEHKHNILEGFTKKYEVHQLVYFESTEDSLVAIEREKCLKRWKRQWKIRLIEEKNPAWNDLYPQLAE